MSLPWNGAPDSRWDAVARLFDAALDAPPHAREALLASCGDEAVRTEVARLLRRHDDLESASPTSSPAGPLTLDARRAVALVGVDLAPGSMLGRYRVLQCIGRGGMGSVYRAEDASLHRTVAVKVLPPWLGSDAAAIDAFVREARLAARVEHPHVATVHEVGVTADGRHFIAMTYCAGGSLRDRLQRGALPVADVLRIGAQLASGLAAVHACGIVHRDVKPENVLFAADGAVRLADFGIAHVAAPAVTASRDSRGTAAYMSPEQALAGDVDVRTDLWAMGVVLYEAITGQRPFTGDTSAALHRAIRDDRPAPIIRHIVPRELEQLVLRCLEKQPARRPPSASALANALTRLSAPWWSRHRLVTSSSAVVALGAFAVIGAVAGGDGPRVVTPTRLAVMPFRERGESASGDALAVALTEDVTSSLAADARFSIAPPVGVEEALRRGVGARRATQLMGASTWLQAGIVRAGDSVRVDAVLLRVADSMPVATFRLTRAARDASLLPHAIGRQVAAQLLGDEGQATVVRPAVDPVAFELTLRGRRIVRERDLPHFNEAADHFREALARDSSIAAAYVGLAEVYTAGMSTAPGRRMRQARPLIERALALDSTLASAHRALGWILMWHDRDWNGAERHLRRAIALDPSDVWTHHSYAAFLSATGLADSGLAVTRRAAVLDPVSSMTATHVGTNLLWRGRVTEAIAVLEDARARDGTWPRTRSVLGRAYLAAGRYDEALLALEGSTFGYASFAPPALRIYALGTMGRRDDARRALAAMEAHARGGCVAPVNFVAAHLGLGDRARALDWAERIPADSGSLFFPLTDHIFAPLQDEPRWQAVLVKLGLGEAARRARDARRAAAVSARQP
ncbi:MAG: protein kinase [Gemmatimonadota bacterium]